MRSDRGRPRWKKVVVGIGLALVAVVGLVVGIGFLLPEAHRITVYAVVPAPPTEVWALVAEPRRAPEWRSDVERVETEASIDGQPAWTEVGPSGSLPMVLVESVPETRRVTRIRDEELPFGGTWTVELAPTPAGGTRVTITEDGRVYNPVFRFISRFVMGHYGTAERYLRDLGAHLGVEVSPVRV